MSVEVVSSGSYGLEIKEEDEFQSTTWNGKEVCAETTKTRKLFFGQAMSLISQNNPHIDHYSYPIGVCPKGHLAYHIYHQSTQPPINLCDEKREWCIFEYYNFLAFLRGEISNLYLRKKN